MIIDKCEQGSEEWFAARCGIPTASNFSMIITGTGKASTQATKYRNILLAESLSGVSHSIKTTEWMERGNVLEEEARNLYQFDQDVEVQQVGLCYPNEQKQYSCSPDGLVGDNGGLEIKCPAPHTHIEYLIGGTLPTTYIPQVQGSMLVTGREWWDFMSYSPGLPPLIIRVPRDEKYICAMDGMLQRFVADLEATKQQLLHLTIG